MFFQGCWGANYCQGQQQPQQQQCQCQGNSGQGSNQAYCQGYWQGYCQAYCQGQGYQGSSGGGGQGCWGGGVSQGGWGGGGGQQGCWGSGSSGYGGYATSGSYANCGGGGYSAPVAQQACCGYNNAAPQQTYQQNPGYGSGWGNYGVCVQVYVCCPPGTGKYGGKSTETPAPPKIKDSDEPKKEEQKKVPSDVRKLNDDGALARVGSWATVVLEVPADAKTYVDGKLMTSKSTRRVIQTPALEEGETYFYDIRMEVVRDGKTISQEKRVFLTPGQRVATCFDDVGSPPPATASK